MTFTFSLSPANQISQAEKRPEYPVIAFPQPKVFHFKRYENLHYRSDGGLWRIQTGYVRWQGHSCGVSLTWNLEGESVPLGFWAEGDIVGCTISQMHPYEAQCLTAVTAEYLGNACGLSQAVLLAQVRQSNDLLRIAHCRQSERRLLQFICWLASAYGEPTPVGRRILLKLTHQEIAETIGVTRVTVTRLLKVLERDGKIIWTAHEKMVDSKTFEQSYEPFYGTD